MKSSIFEHLNNAWYRTIINWSRNQYNRIKLKMAKFYRLLLYPSVIEVEPIVPKKSKLFSFIDVFKIKMVRFCETFVFYYYELPLLLAWWIIRSRNASFDRIEIEVKKGITFVYNSEVLISMVVSFAINTKCIGLRGSAELSNGSWSECRAAQHFLTKLKTNT